MPVVIKTPKTQIKMDFKSQFEERVIKVCVNTLAYVGETCIREARDNGKYEDQTGNLRSSIGYAVVYHGVTMSEMKQQLFSGPGGDGSKGADEGKQFLDVVKSKYNQGLALILTAGMNYAVYVEAKGLNVLTSAELIAEQLVPQLMKRLGFTVK